MSEGKKWHYFGVIRILRTSVFTRIFMRRLELLRAKIKCVLFRTGQAKVVSAL